MIKREKAPLLLIILLYLIAIAVFVFFGQGKGRTWKPTYEKLYNRYIVYRINLPGDDFESERSFAFKLLEGAQRIKPDFRPHPDSTYYDPKVFQNYLPEGTNITAVYSKETSIGIDYISKNGNKVSVFFPKIDNYENIPVVSVTVPSVEQVEIYNRPENFIAYTYLGDYCNDTETFFPSEKGPSRRWP